MIFLDKRLEIRKTADRGWGVFTTKKIAAEETIECSPVIVMSPEERKLLDQTKLHDYIFEWGEDHKSCIMAMGYIPVYNHRSPSNAEYAMDYEKGVIFIVTKSAIAADEEIFINYHGDFDIQKKLWFQPK